MARRVAGGSRADGMPIEEAPLWVLAIATGVFWLPIFPALVGLLDGFDLYRGHWGRAALGAGALAVALVAGLASRKPWRRPEHPSPFDERPRFVRFSTWLMTAAVVPNVLQGVLVLVRKGPRPDYFTSLAIGAIVAAVHGAYALAERWKSRKKGTS